MRKPIFGLLSVLILATLVLSACAPAAPAAEAPAAEAPAAEAPAAEAPAAEAPAAEAPAAEAEAVSASGLPEVDPMSVTGDIVTAGSSTVFPLAEAVAARFQDEGYAGKITIDSIGSGAGFERFCKTGETDVANASRKIKDEEIANCQAIGREPVGFKVGVDALAVVVSKENTFITGASMEELAKIFSDQAEKWSDVNPDWPAEPILRFIPGTDSGTFDYFVEEVFDKEKEPHLNAKNTQLSEDDNVLVQGVEGSPYAVGYFGYAYFVENAEKLNVLAIDGVTPEDATVQDNSYPLSRPLYLYSDAKIMADKPQVGAYINYFLSVVNDEIGAVGYFPLNAADYKASVDAFTGAAK